MTLSTTKAVKRPSAGALLLMACVCLVACSNQASSKNTDKVANAGQVYIADGSKQCQSITADISHFTTQLQNANIKVSGQYCGQITGTYYPAVCGAQNGKVYVFSVDSLDAAKALGFSAVAGLPEGQGIIERPCPQIGQPAKIKL